MYKHSGGFRQPVVGIRQPVVGIRQPVVGIHQPVVGIRLTAAELRSCVYIQLSVSNFGFSDKLQIVFMGAEFPTFRAAV